MSFATLESLEQPGALRSLDSWISNYSALPDEFMRARVAFADELGTTPAQLILEHGNLASALMALFYYDRLLAGDDEAYHRLEARVNSLQGDDRVRETSRATPAARAKRERKAVARAPAPVRRTRTAAAS